MTKKITSRAEVRSPQSEFVRETCDLLKIFQLLGIISDIRMRPHREDIVTFWALEVTCEIKE